MSLRLYLAELCGPGMGEARRPSPRSNRERKSRCQERLARQKEPCEIVPTGTELRKATMAF